MKPMHELVHEQEHESIHDEDEHSQRQDDQWRGEQKQHRAKEGIQDPEQKSGANQ